MNAFFTDFTIATAAKITDKIANMIAQQLPQLFAAAPKVCCNESQIQDDKQEDKELERMFVEWDKQHPLEQYKAGLAAGRAGEPCPEPDETTQQWFWGYTQGQDEAEQCKMTDDYFASEKAASRAAGYQDGLAEHYEPSYSEWAVPHYNEGWIAAHNDMARTEAALDEILAVGAFSLAMYESQKTKEGAYYSGLHGYGCNSMTDPDLLAHYEIGTQRRTKFATYPTLRPFLFETPYIESEVGYGCDDFTDYTWVQCSDCGEFAHTFRIDANGRCGECFAAAVDKDGDDAFPF